VNGEPVSRDAVRRELAQLRAGEGEPPPELRRRALDVAVERALLVQEARARNIAAPDDEVERALLALRADDPAGQFEELLAQEKTSVDEVKARLRDQLVVERVVAAAAKDAPQVAEAEARAFYDANPQEFEQPAQVRALQIVTLKRGEAEKAREEVARRPASFGDVARRVSVAPEARAGGDLGWFGKGSGMPEVFDACLTLPTGKISPVIPSPYGFHVFKVVDRRPAAKRPFQAVRAEIVQRLERERRARAQEEFVAKLRAAAKIDVDEAAFEAATRETP
jgi:peptidyl-prolyl cis-trans isomerase C